MTKPSEIFKGREYLVLALYVMEYSVEEIVEVMKIPKAEIYQYIKFFESGKSMHLNAFVDKSLGTPEICMCYGSVFASGKLEFLKDELLGLQKLEKVSESTLPVAKIFEGLQFTISSQVIEDGGLKKAITSNGGTVSMVLTTKVRHGFTGTNRYIKTTHYVTNRRELESHSFKISYARRHAVIVIPPEYINECVSKQKRLPESDFEMVEGKFQ